MTLIFIWFCESWLVPERDVEEFSEIVVKDVIKAHHEPRPYNSGGGGICCVYKENLKLVKGKPPKVTTMEVMELNLTINSKLITLVNIYRSESTFSK